MQTLADTAPQAWKNGGGSTRELLAWPDSSNWRVRVSVAAIESDGPFSSFPGVARWFAVLSGAGVVLRVNGEETELLTSSSPFAFCGEALTDCRLLSGPTLDINLMLRGVKGQMGRVNAFQPARLSGQSIHRKWVAIYAKGDGTSVALGSEKLVLPAQTLAWRLCADALDVVVSSDNAFFMEVDL